jgi:hypothetical protein
MTIIRHHYTAWSYPCENDHFALREETKTFYCNYKHNVQKLKSNLEGCPCGKDCKPIPIDIIVEERY